MIRFLLLSFSLLVAMSAISQNTNLNHYSYVIVPNQFDFLNGKDQFQMNSMTKFYFEKSGFNAYMEDTALHTDRCEGLYANVEELKTILGTKLQVVLRDCNDNEIYRSQEGKSKYKEFDKTYQDALRKAFKSVEALGVHQKDVILLENNTTSILTASEANSSVGTKVPAKSKVSNVAGNILPIAKFSNYSNNGKTFLLRKTTEGYSLYEESATAADGLLLKGKIIVMENVLKYMDTDGKVSNAIFDASENLTINNGTASITYKSEN